MTIQIQKILRFIPIVNFITVFLWLHACFTNTIRKKDFFRTAFIMISVFVFANIPYMVASIIFGNMWWVNAVNWICTYLSLFAISHLAIKGQEYIKDNY